jgi:bud site selection protein 20
MGTGLSAKKAGSRSKIKKYKKKVWLKHRTMDTDQLQEQIEKTEETGKPIEFEYDDELPGGGQFYAIETGKHFTDAKALADHKKSRYYKKRVKEIGEEKYNHASADWASGMVKEVLPPAHAKK